MSIMYSVVVPLKNEEENIQELVTQIQDAMDTLDTSWELICVDDGSTDKTLDKLKKLNKTCPELKTIVFEKNYGQSSAFDAGFKAAAGSYVITLDGDLQNDPKDIPKLIKELDTCDMVCGIRKKRKDPFHKKMISKMANYIRGRILTDGVSDTGCSLKAYRKECLDKITLYHGMHRFLPALFKIEGFRIKEVIVNHRPRQAGSSKYHLFNRSFNTVADMFAVRWMAKRKLNYKVDKEVS